MDQQLTPEQLAALSPEDKKELEALTTEATETATAIAAASAYRLKLALAGAKAASYAVILFNLLVKIDGRSALGKATANALASFNVVGLELDKEIAAAKAQQAEAEALAAEGNDSAS